MASQRSQPGAIADSSPLIHFARIGRLDIIQALFGIVAVPEAVWHEVVDESLTRPGSTDLASAAWIQRVAAPRSDLLDTIRLHLDPGESEAIALAHANASSIPLIVDERRARSTARSLDLQIIGSAGLLLLAKRNDLVTAVDVILQQLMQSGFRLSDDIATQILAEAGEL